MYGEIDFQLKKKGEIIMVNFVKIGNAAKFLFNRARGVNYGCVRFQGGKIQLIKTDKLRKLNIRLNKKVGEYAEELSQENYQTIMQQTRPLQRGANIQTTGQNLQYLNVHGGMQVWDRDANRAVVDVVERLNHPIRTYFGFA